MPWQQLHPLCFFESTFKSRQKVGKRGKQCKLWIFFPGNLWPAWSSCWTMLAHEAAVAEHPPHYDLQSLTQDRAGRIILMLLLNCSQITPLEAQLWFYNVQLPCVKWGWCFQETGALMECLCSGEQEIFYPCIESWNCLFYIESAKLGWMRLRRFTITLPVLTLITDLDFGPISRTVCSEELFWLGQNWRPNSFWQICQFFGVDQSSRAASVLLARNSCLLEKPSFSLGLANVLSSIVLHAGKVQPTNLEFILFSSEFFNTLICFLQRAQTTISSAWQTNRRSTKKICII